MSEPTCTSIYLRMSKALDKGRGVRLSAYELEILYTMDDAINTVIENVREGYDIREGYSAPASREEGDSDDE